MSVKFLKNTLVPFLIFILGISASLGLWKISDESLDKQSELEFELDVNNVIDSIQKRLDRDVKLLYSLRALYYSSQFVDRGEFTNFANSVEMQKNYPGIGLLGYQELVLDKDKEKFVSDFVNDTLTNPNGYPDFKIFPEGSRSEYVVLKYAYPEEGVSSAFGFDVLTESSRSRVALASRDENLPLMSDLINILPNNDPGFLIYLPVFKDNSVNESLEWRRDNLKGYLTVVFKNKDFFGDISEEFKFAGREYFSFSIHDTDSISNISEKNLFFNFVSKENQLSKKQSNLVEILLLDFYGHKWSLKFEAPNNYALSYFQSIIPEIVLLFSLLLTLCATWIIYVLLNSRSQALKLASEITEDLSESEEKFKAITESAKDAIIMMDNLGKVVFWNQAAEILFGYKEKEILGKDLHNLIPFEKEHREKKSTLNNFFITGESEVIGKNVTVPVKNKKGDKIIVELAISKVKINGLWHAVGIMRDVTERKKAEDELRLKTEELEKLNQNMIGRELKMIQLKEEIAKLKDSKK